MSSNPKVLPIAIGMEAIRTVLMALRTAPGHQFLVDDVSLTDHDVPRIAGHRQVTDVHLLTLARRRGVRVVTFASGLSTLASSDHVEVLRVL